MSLVIGGVEMVQGIYVLVTALEPIHRHGKCYDPLRRAFSRMNVVTTGTFRTSFLSQLM